MLQLYLKETPAQAVCYEFCEIFKNTSLTEKLWNTASVNGPRELCGIFRKILCERYHFNQTQILFNLSWCITHSIIAMFLRKLPRKVIAWHSLIGICGISHIFKIMYYKTLKNLKQMFPRLLLLYPCGVFKCLLPLLYSSATKNMKMKMLNSSLITVFILYAVPTSKSSCSLVLCSKAVLRLALIHSKYTGHGKIAKIRTQ